MANVSSYRCTVYNAKNVRKKCVIYAYQTGKQIYFTMTCRAARIAVDVYGDMNNIVNYIKKHSQILSQLTYALRVDERYIFANIIECLDTVNREMGWHK